MNLLIGCSSRDDIPKKYKKDCTNYLEVLLKDNNLIFGACANGLMGISYQVAKQNNNKVTAITPKIFQDDLKKLVDVKEVITSTISRRTDSLFKKSDAFIFLPGGVGTIYELFSAIEFKRSGEFDKPIIIYNSHGYYDNLLAFLELTYQEKFTKEEVKRCYHISTSYNDTLEYLKNYKKKN